jgi:lysophospholipase L1-like esterase
MASGGRDTGDGAARRPRRRYVVTGALGFLLVVVAGAAVAIAGRATSDGDADRGPAASGPDVAVVGDSLIEQSRDQFVAHAEERGLTVRTWAYGGSAPCDWLDVFDELAAAPPDHLVISFSGNDYTPCVNPDGGPPRDPATVAAAYAEMMPGIVDRFADGGAAVYVVVPPPVGEPSSEPTAAAVRAVYTELAAERPWLTIVDPAPLLGPDRRFHLTLPCEAWEADDCRPDGTVTVRRDDGIHLTPTGGERYARSLMTAIGHPVQD